MTGVEELADDQVGSECIEVIGIEERVACTMIGSAIVLTIVLMTDEKLFVGKTVEFLKNFWHV